MRNPPYVQYQKTQDGEIRTEFAVRKTQEERDELINAYLNEAKERGYIVCKVNRGGDLCEQK